MSRTRGVSASVTVAIVIAVIAVAAAGAYALTLRPQVVTQTVVQTTGISVTQTQTVTAPIESKNVKLGYSGFLSQIPDFVAVEKGYFREVGLEVELKKITPATGVQALVAGELNILDHGYGPDLINAKLGGQDIVMLAGGWVVQGGDQNQIDQGFFIRKDLYDSGVKTLQQIKGGRIGSPRQGGLVYMIFDDYMLRQGVKESDFVLQFGPPDQLIQAFEAKQLSAVMVGEPFTTVLRDKGHFPLFYERDVYKAGEVRQLTSLWANRDWVKQNENTVRAYLQAYLKALQYYLPVLAKDSADQARRNEIAQYTSKYLGIPKETILTINWDRYYADAHANVESFKLTSQYLMDRGFVKGIVEAEKWFYTGITLAR